MKKSAALSTLIILLAVSISFNYYQYFIQSAKESELIELKGELNYRNDKFSQLQKRQLATSQFANAFPLETEVESFSSDVSILRNLLKKRTLVYSFSYLDCIECAIKQLNLLGQFKKENEIDVMILMAYDNSRAFKNYARMSNGAIPIWGTAHALPFGEQCYFVLETDGKANNFFIPEASDDDSTNNYLKMIKDKVATRKPS